jgi:hypothetical protein
MSGFAASSTRRFASAERSACFLGKAAPVL